MSIESVMVSNHLILCHPLLLLLSNLSQHQENTPGVEYTFHIHFFLTAPKHEKASDEEMAEWHHRCNEHELGQALGGSEGQEGLACHSPQGCKQLDTPR